jgi:hypothetical protein
LFFLFCLGCFGLFGFLFFGAFLHLFFCCHFSGTSRDV